MIATTPQVRPLLIEATHWRMLGLLFSCPRPGWLEQLDALAAAADDSCLQQAAVAARDEAGESAYHTIFGPGGPAAAREVSYQRAAFTGRFLAELQDAYAAFAYESATGEAPDHVATQADFVGYLRLKEAFARARGHAEQAELTARMARRIIGDHLALVAQPLAQTLQAAGFRYLALASAALAQRVGAAPQHAGPEPPLLASLLPLAADSCPCDDPQEYGPS